MVLPGAVDAEVLEQAWQEARRRWPSLKGERRAFDAFANDLVWPELASWVWGHQNTPGVRQPRRRSDVGSHEGLPYLVHELVPGESLASLIQRRALDTTRALELGLQIARGLAAAHAQGVVHRDLKPQDLLVTDEGTLKILDFGLAKVTAIGEELGDDDTQPGMILGTCGYLAPEQARGEPADTRSDLFAAGAILFEMLTGHRAFDGATQAERLSSRLYTMRPAAAV